MKAFRKPSGWQGESYRHYLAAKGVKTGKVRSYFAPQWGDVVNRAIADARSSRAQYIEAAAYRRGLAERGFTERMPTVAEVKRAELEWQKTALRPGVRSQLERMQFYADAEGTLGLPTGSLRRSLPRNFKQFDADLVDPIVAVPLLRQLVAMSEAEVEEGRANRTSLVPAKERYLYYASLLKMVEQGMPLDDAVQLTIISSPHLFGSMSSTKLVELLDDISLPPGVRRKVSKETLEELEENNVEQVPQTQQELEDPTFYDVKSREDLEQQEALSKLGQGATYVAPAKLTQVNVTVERPVQDEEPSIMNITPAEKIRVASGLMRDMEIPNSDALAKRVSSDVNSMTPEARQRFEAQAPDIIAGLMSAARARGMKVDVMQKQSGVTTTLTKSPYTTASSEQVAELERRARDLARNYKEQRVKGKQYEAKSADGADDDYLPEEGGGQ
jgi:hypothetical protein